MGGEIKVSEMDEKHLRLIRENVTTFLSECAREYDGEGLLLDIAPQVHEGARPHFTSATVYTLDIDPEAGADYTADLCRNNSDKIPDNHFDRVVCTEVLEHTLNPFDAVKEIRRVMKPGGLVFVTTPFNFRIHGPLPDCWRFTEYGLRELLKDFEIIKLEELGTKGRDLMPIQYVVIARKKMEPGK